MPANLRPPAEPWDVALLDVLEQLRQTKRLTLRLIERWGGETRDSEIRAGLATHVIDERRHYRTYSELIMRLGGRLPGAVRSDGLTRVFAEIETEKDDLLRICALHRAVKPFTVDRCAHLLPLVSTPVARVMEPSIHDDERHVRWADLRLERLLTYDRMREFNLRMARMRVSIEAAWERPWQAITRAAEREQRQPRPGA